MPNMILLWLGVYLSVVLGTKYKKGGGKHHSQIPPLSGLDAQSEKQRSSDHATTLAETLLQSQCNDRKCQKKIRKGKIDACSKSYCNGCAACNYNPGGRSSSSACTVGSACGGSRQCSQCRSCLLNAMGSSEMQNQLIKIQDGQWGGASSACKALENARKHYDISQCCISYPTCSSYLICKDTGSTRPLRLSFGDICPEYVAEQCQDCSTILSLASRASGGVNASASQAVVNANMDIRSENEIATEVSFIQGSNMEKLGQEDDLDSVYERKGGCREKGGICEAPGKL